MGTEWKEEEVCTDTPAETGCVADLDELSGYVADLDELCRLHAVAEVEKAAGNVLDIAPQCGEVRIIDLDVAPQVEKAAGHVLDIDPQRGAERSTGLDVSPQVDSRPCWEEAPLQLELAPESCMLMNPRALPMPAPCESPADEVPSEGGASLHDTSSPVRSRRSIPVRSRKEDPIAE